MVNQLENLSVESVVVPLNALRVESDRPAKDCRSRQESDRHTRVVLPDGRRMQVSGRFWSSFSSLLNLSRSVFDYFSHEEVFDRITRTKGQSVRVACEIIGDTGRMLSCTSPTKPILRVDEVRSLTEEFGGTGISYADGIQPISRWRAMIFSRDSASRCLWMATGCRQHSWRCCGLFAPTE